MEAGDVLLGRYELHDELGRGSSRVFRAFDRKIRRQVAIKALDIGHVAGREARTLASLNHSNIVTLYDLVEENGQAYLVMELVDGRPLSDILDRGPLSSGAAAGIASEICRALEAAHSNGIVHLDIKPKNIIVTPGGRVKVADFGIASLSGGRGTGRGTPAYTSPEQADSTVVDDRSDIFSLGCLLYEMLTGDSPFAALTTEGSLKKVKGHSPSPPGTLVRLPKGFDEVVMKALRKKPAERFQSAKDFRKALEEFSDLSELKELTGDRAVDEPGRTLFIEEVVAFFLGKPAFAGRLLASALSAGLGYMLFQKEAALPAAAIGGAAGAIHPLAGLAFVLGGAFFRVLLFSPGLALIVAPPLALYFLAGMKRPVAALAPAGSALLLAIGLGPLFPLLVGLVAGPIFALVVGLAGGAVHGGFFAFADGLEGLKGVVNPLVAGHSLVSILGRSPAILLQPLLWGAVAAGLSTARRSFSAWLAVLIAFLVEASAYYWIAETYAGVRIEAVMRGLAFSLIIVVLLALGKKPGRGRVK